MAEILKFPTPEEVTSIGYVVCDDTNQDEICHTNTREAAQTIARTLSGEWPGIVFTVISDKGTEMFRVCNEYEEETI